MIFKWVELTIRHAQLSWRAAQYVVLQNKAIITFRPVFQTLWFPKLAWYFLFPRDTEIRKLQRALRAHIVYVMGYAVAQLVHCSIPIGVNEIFLWLNHSDRTMALESTEPIKEMSARDISWVVKAVGIYGWQPCHRLSINSRSLNLLEPEGSVQACNWISLLSVV